MPTKQCLNFQFKEKYSVQNICFVFLYGEETCRLNLSIICLIMHLLDWIGCQYIETIGISPCPLSPPKFPAHSHIPDILLLSLTPMDPNGP